MYKEIIQEIIQMRGIEIAGTIIILVGSYLMTIASFCNLLVDLNFYKGIKKQWIKHVIENVLMLLFLLFINIVGTYWFIIDIRHPKNKVETLKNHVESAQKALDKYLEEHPEYKEIKEK